jgi:hypothetical protein
MADAEWLPLPALWPEPLTDRGRSRWQSDKPALLKSPQGSDCVPDSRAENRARNPKDN